MALPKFVPTSETASFSGRARMHYETPPQGITITGYIVRRLHKTSLLESIRDLLGKDYSAALAQFAAYAAAASSSYGPALYQPQFDRPGSKISEADPDTGALVTVQQLARQPHIAFEYRVQMPNGDLVSGRESILGTTVGLHGLGMPAPSLFEFQSAQCGYTAHAAGTICSELAPNWANFGATQVRAHGTLELSDNMGHSGSLKLDRKGHIEIVLCGGQQQRRFTFDL
ncbi:MAG: hypothetical protein HXY40_07180 [Chloroflexi bacterium]|nr:hypothetical protein [Chloroflexota bacterium]